MESIVESFDNRYSSRRIILLSVKGLLVVFVIVLIAGWFIGAIPPYPNMRAWRICSYPQIISSSLFGIERRQLLMAVCFSTTDSLEQVAKWYEVFGWTGQNTVKDAYGTPIIGRINLGQWAQILIKRHVLFSLYEPLDVKVVAAYEIRSDIFSNP